MQFGASFWENLKVNYCKFLIFLQKRQIYKAVLALESGGGGGRSILPPQFLPRASYALGFMVKMNMRVEKFCLILQVVLKQLPIENSYCR